MLLREIALDNGLCLRFTDNSRHYYGGFHAVCVTVHGELLIHPEFCRDEAAFSDAVTLLGDRVTFTRVLERMGVPESDIAAVRESLVDQFIGTALGYLGNKRFPMACIEAELEKKRKKRRKFTAGFAR